MMTRIIMMMVITAIIWTKATTQNPYWESSKGPYGGDFSLVKAPDGSLYATDTYGNWKETYHSVDQGLTWQQLTFLQDFFPNDQNKKVLISDAGTVYLTIPSQHATYKTTNDGQTWETAYGFHFEFASETLIKTENNTIFRSSNSGQSWSPVLNYPSGNIYRHLLYNTPFGGFVFECGRTVPGNDTILTLYRSFDEGANWAAQDVDPLFFNFFFTPTGTFLCTKADTLYRSTDNGVTFHSTGLPDIYSPTFAVLPSGRILMERYSTLLYSDDDGTTWSTLSNWQEGSGGRLYPVPLNDGTVFKVHQKALLRSADGGLNWQFSGTGMRANTTTKMVFNSDSMYYAFTPVGLWKTENAGETWNLYTPDNVVRNNGGYFGVTDAGGVALLQSDRLFWSADGSTFTNVTPPNGLDIINYGPNFSLNPQSGYFYINTVAGLERSVDFGQSWELLLDSTLFLSGMGFHPSGRMIGFSWLGQIMLSDNNGTSWTPVLQISENPFVSAIRVAPNGDVYLIGGIQDTETFLWKSEDAGETWMKMPAKLDQTLWWLPIFEIAANGHLFTAVNQDISLSTNEGLTWQTIPSPVDSIFISQYWGRISGLAISPNQHLFAGTEHFGLSKSVNPVSLGVTIEGFIRVDADADCSTDDSQSPLSNRSIKARGEDITYYTKSDPLGRYVFFLDTGIYKVSLQNLHQIWWAYCDSVETINLPTYNTADTANFSAIALSECPLITVNAAIPLLRRCFNNPIYVQYCNQGSETADSAWVDVILDPYLSFTSSLQPYNELANNTIRFFIGDIESGECGQFLLVAQVDCDSTVLGQTHCITAHGFPDTLCTTVPNWSGANIEAAVTCQDSIVRFELKNTGPASSQMLDYIIIEDDVVMFQGQQQYNPGQSLTLPLPATGHTLRIESQQEPGHPFSTRAIAFEEGCGGFESLGFINQFSVNGITPSWHRVCLENIGSYDPNDKRGYPIGTGAEHRIRPGQPIEYMIRFQNTGTDTAFTIVVRDTLSPWLDPASIVPGAASHPYTWQLDGQGVISFNFSNILLPDSTTNLDGSQGFLTFWIAQQPAVPLGTQIYNDAAIFFDFNAPVITNETLHTVGEDLVSSTVEIPGAKKTAGVEVSPNPAHDFATFSMSKSPFKHHHLHLFDPLGKPVYDVDVNGFHCIIPRKGLVAGAYGWRVTDAFGRLVDSGILIFL